MSYISEIYAKDDKRQAYIHSRIEDQIAYYEAKSSYNKRLYYCLSVAAVVANSAVPVVSLFLPSSKSGEFPAAKLAVLLLSACAAVITSMLTLFNAKDLWNKYRNNANRLQALLHQYYSGSGVFEDMEEEQAFRLLVRLSEDQMEEENKGWENMFSHDAPPAQKP